MRAAATKVVGPACSKRAPYCEFAGCLLWITNNTGDALRRHWKRLGANWQIGVLVKSYFFLKGKD